METLQLKYFFESAVGGSFAKTAEKYMVPTSSVSASVKRLENELGCTLFDRKSNKIVLNSNGVKLMNSLKIVFAELENTIESISTPREDTREIKMLVRSVRRDITDYIVQYKESHPKTSFKTVFDFAESNFDNYDIIIDEKSNSYPNWESFSLCSLKLVLKAASGKFPKNAKMSLSSLKNEAFVSFGEQSNTHRLLVNECEKAGFTPNIAVQSNDIDCHERFIESGICIGVGLEGNAPIKSDRVTLLNVEDFNQRYEIYCYYRKDAYYGNVKHFLDFLGTKSR